MLKHVPLALVYCCRDLRVRWINDAAARMFGFEPDAMVGHVLYDLVPGMEELRPIYERVLAGESLHLPESRIRFPDGDRFYDVHYRSVRSESDPERVVGLLAAALEITERKLGEAAVAEKEERFRRIFTESPIGMAVLSPEHRILDVNETFSRMLGYTEGELTGRGSPEITHPHDVELDRRLAGRVFSGEIPSYQMEKRYLRKNGEPLWVRTTASAIRNGGDRPVYGLTMAEDITEWKQVQDELHKLSRAVEQSPGSVIITSTDGVIEYVNPRFELLTGYTAEEAIGQTPRILKSDRMSEAQYEELWRTISDGREWRGELYNRKKDGELYWESMSITPVRAADGIITHYLGVGEDISVRKEYEQRLLRQANYDDLTGLPNRTLAADRLSHGLAGARRHRQTLAVMFIDLDHFKIINDTTGHEAGDELLREAADRLRNCVRDTDTVARLGGDEFLVLLAELTDAKDSERVAVRILDEFSKAFHVGGQEFFVTASIGITVYPQDGDDPQSLLRNADAAMYHAKDDGRDTFRFFAPEMNQDAARRLEIEPYVRHALERDELVLHYQPIVEVGTGKVVGMEALLRIENADVGLLSPDRFIGLAESTGLIVPIGEWVIQEACSQAAKWADLLGEPLRISVNVSPRQFRGEGLVAVVSGSLDACGLEPGLLELEVTEHLLAHNHPRLGRILDELREIGVRLSLDDFGAGHSALGYLKRFSFDTLKIDRMFIQDVPDDPENSSLVTAIVAMAHGLGLHAVAEGVETQEQQQFLQELGCDLLQGFYFSKPLPPREFEALLRDGARLGN